jgi:hypothetical protein
MDRSELESLGSVHKITWQKAGSVTEPGRYMFKFGWPIVTADDLAIWRQFPDATFTLSGPLRKPEKNIVWARSSCR